MVKSNTTHKLATPAPVWRMPIVMEDYPQRDPFVTDAEAALMEYYVREFNDLIGAQAKLVLKKLQRFEQPFRDVHQLHAKADANVAKSRRHLFQFMIQTRRAFWSWSGETWSEVIRTVRGGEPQTQGNKFGLFTLAYLLSGFLYIGTSAPYKEIANTIFGKERVDAEWNKLYTPLIALGYSQHPLRMLKFGRLCATTMLINRSPDVEAFSAQLLVTMNELVPHFFEKTVGKRQDLRLIQTALCELGILDEPAILVSGRPQPVPPSVLWQNDPTMDPLWLAWVCAFYEQTPHTTEKTLRHTCYDLLTAGRWLKKTHPEIHEPAQWDETLAAEYTLATCQSLCGEYSPLLQHTQYARPQKLSPSGINQRLAAMRKFFFHLQRRPYVVEGKPYPKLHLAWLPSEGFATPDTIKAAIQPNPKDIQEDIWFKLIWAACTLSKEQLDAAGSHQYPLAYYRAVSLVWVTAARRSDEIKRLSVGCVRREWASEMCNEQGQQIEPAEELCYLRVPTNKMRGEFYIPIPAYVADAIEVWESVRPPNQEMLEDRKTHKSTKYLFQYRNERMGKTFLNVSVIPLLCKLAAVSQTDIVGPITSHRARATTATWMRKMGMAPADIGKLLGHTNPARSLPWYMREDKHHLGRAYRKANPLERYVAAILDTNAHAKQEPCVFYYLADGPDGRPRMCGNPHFSRCIHQMACQECEAFISSEMAQVIERREGAVIISVPIPLPPQIIDELNEQDEADDKARAKRETLPPPTLPGPAFHFNKKVPLRPTADSPEDLSERLAQVEAQISKRQINADRRSASLQALLKERTELQARLDAQEKIVREHK